MQLLAHRWRVGWVVLGVAVLAIAACVTVTAVLSELDDDYGPIEFGGFFGPAGSPGIASDDSGTSIRYRLVTKGDQTAYVYSSMGNAGEHSVKITGIDTDSVTVGAQWAPMPSSEDVAVPQRNAAWRDFPATVHDHIIQIRYEIRRPPYCRDHPMEPGSGTFYSDHHTVRWESLLSDHQSVVGADLDLEIQIC